MLKETSDMWTTLIPFNWMLMYRKVMAVTVDSSSQQVNYDIALPPLTFLTVHRFCYQPSYILGRYILPFQTSWSYIALS